LRSGEISSRQADLIVAVAGDVPEIETDRLRAAAQGVVPLRDAAVTARAAREDPAARAARHQAARSYRMWTAADGMVEGHFKVTPEVGGAIRARMDHGTRKRFRDARKAGARESQDAYAADAFARRCSANRPKPRRRLHDPRRHRSRGARTRRGRCG
jgi:hypothetical protein